MPPVTVGEALSDALTWAYDAPNSTFASGEQERLGAAHGYAFRAAELAYDLGQRHGRGPVCNACDGRGWHSQGMRPCGLHDRAPCRSCDGDGVAQTCRSRGPSPEEIMADRAAARERALRRDQNAAERAGLLLALDTRN